MYNKLARRKSRGSACYIESLCKLLASAEKPKMKVVKAFAKKNTNMLHQLELYWTKIAGVFINVIICSSSLERQNVGISKQGRSLQNCDISVA